MKYDFYRKILVYSKYLLYLCSRFILRKYVRTGMETCTHVQKTIKRHEKYCIYHQSGVGQ